MSIKSQRNDIDLSSTLIANQRAPHYVMNRAKEDKMPLIKGKKAETPEGISENISIEKHAHPEMPIKQAVAIGYSEAREAKKHHAKHESHHRHKEHR